LNSSRKIEFGASGHCKIFTSDVSKIAADRPLSKMRQCANDPKPTFATVFVGGPAYQCGYCAWPQCGNPFADRLKNSRQHSFTADGDSAACICRLRSDDRIGRRPIVLQTCSTYPVGRAECV